MKGFGIATFAALGAGLGLGFAAPPAQAQAPVCGDLFEECRIADDTLAWNADEFAEFFPLDEDTCSAMAEGVFAQCKKAVKAGVNCWTDQFNSIPKNAKPACKTERSPASDCKVEFKYAAHNDVNITQATLGPEIVCCEGAALDFFDLCVGEI
jgi:hypothetical protein